MLNARTLIVLGAGASYDFGMPLGGDFSKTIAKKVDIKFEYGSRQISGDPAIMEALRLIARREERDANLYRAAGCAIAQGIAYSRSIDSYFSAHEHDPYVKTCGKLAIVQSILEAERHSALWVDQSRAHSKFRDYDKVIASWLSDLMFILTNQIGKTTNLDQVFNNLVIVNFNYDRCLEQFFLYALRDLFQINESEAAELVASKLRILRPYGKVGELPMGLSGGVAFGEDLHPAKLESLANGIRTFNEQVEDDDLINSVHEEVAFCDRAIFLGFHFHKQNTDFLTSQTFHALGRKPRRCYGTATDRSAPDVTVLTSRVKGIFHGQALTVELGTGWDCKGIFKTFATSWSA